MENKELTGRNDFAWNLNSDVSILDENSKAIDREEMLRKQQESIIVSEKLQVGEIVKLKKTDYLVEIKYVDYEIEGIGFIDYAGAKCDDDTFRGLVLFNQKDIEKKIDKQNSPIIR